MASLTIWAAAWLASSFHGNNALDGIPIKGLPTNFCREMLKDCIEAVCPSLETANTLNAPVRPCASTSCPISGTNLSRFMPTVSHSLHTLWKFKLQHYPPSTTSLLSRASARPLDSPVILRADILKTRQTKTRVRVEERVLQTSPASTEHTSHSNWSDDTEIVFSSKLGRGAFLC